MYTWGVPFFRILAKSWFEPMKLDDFSRRIRIWPQKQPKPSPKPRKYRFFKIIKNQNLARGGWSTRGVPGSCSASHLAKKSKDKTPGVFFHAAFDFDTPGP